MALVSLCACVHLRSLGGEWRGRMGMRKERAKRRARMFIQMRRVRLVIAFELIQTMSAKLAPCFRILTHCLVWLVCQHYFTPNSHNPLAFTGVLYRASRKGYAEPLWIVVLSCVSELKCGNNVGNNSRGDFGHHHHHHL